MKLHVSSPHGGLMLPVIQKAENAARFGLSAAEVRSSINTLLNGLKVGEIYENQKIFDVSSVGNQ